MATQDDWAAELSAQLDANIDSPLEFEYEDGDKKVQLVIEDVQFTDDVILVKLAKF